MIVSQDWKDQIRSSVSLDQFISRYVSLKKRGRSYVGLCPFHNEKSPSFHVNSEEGFYHCFGCKASGDIFQFVMKIQGVDFPQATQVLAGYSGIPIPESGSEDNFKQNNLAKENIYKVNQKATELYHQYLFSYSGKSAMEYILSRGITEQEIKQFKIGYSPDDFQFLETQFKSPEDRKSLLDSGLWKENEKRKGQYYDFFRGRIQFPIIDVSGRVLGFTARSSMEGQEPKYVNSPNSLVYDKGKSFFNLYLAQDTIRKSKRAVVVEGVLDAIGLYSRGIRNTIAPLGTSFTEGQARLLKSFTDSIVFWMDSDSAGKKGALRAIEICTWEGIPSQVVIQKSGKDPFDLSRTTPSEELSEMIQNSIPSEQFYIQNILETNGSNLQDRKSYDELFHFLSKMNREVEKETFLRQASKHTGIRFESLWSDFLKFQGKENFKTQKPDIQIQNRKKSTSPIKSAYKDCERKMVAFLVLYPELFDFSFEIESLTFLDEGTNFLWDLLFSKHLEGESMVPADFMSLETIPSDWKEEVSVYFSESPLKAEETYGAFQSLIQKQKVHSIDREMERLTKELGDPAISDEDRMEKLSKFSYLRVDKQKLMDSFRESSQSVRSG
jgi:DNA primase